MPSSEFLCPWAWKNGDFRNRIKERFFWDQMKDRVSWDRMKEMSFWDRIKEASVGDRIFGLDMIELPSKLHRT